MEVGDYIQALNAARSLTPDWREGDLTEAQLATERARPDLIRAQTQQTQFETQKGVAEQQREVDERTRFRKRLGDLGASPSPTSLYQVAADFPDFAPSILKAADGMSAEAKSALVKTAAPLFALIQRGQFDKARDGVDRMIKADEASGVATDEHTLELRDILHGDDVEQKRAAGGMLYGMIASVNTDTAAKTLADFEAARTRGQVVGKTIGHYDGTGKWVLDYQAPDYHVLRPEQKLIETTGAGLGGTVVAQGADASGGVAEGPAGGVRRTNGWTPRERDGGDNPSSIVDAKLGTLSKRLAIDVDAPLTKAQIGPLAEAIAATEGGKGSLADRNNNPTNIRDGAFAKSRSGYDGPGEGGYARFKSPGAGMAAAKGLLSRYFERGQRTIRDIIEGEPVGGAGPAPRGGARVVADGGPAPSYRMLTPAEVARRPGLDPSRPYQISPNGRVTPVGGSGGGSGKGSGGGTPRTLTAVIAPILQKVAAGQTLTAGEESALRYYRAKGGKGGSPAAAGPSGKPPPKVGTVMDGHRFIGGDPGKRSNWVVVK